MSYSVQILTYINHKLDQHSQIKYDSANTDYVISVSKNGNDNRYWPSRKYLTRASFLISTTHYRHRFDPRPSHTKDFKNDTSCSFAWRSALRKQS